MIGTSPDPADPYLDPASGVLRNLPGITDAERLARYEAEAAFAREYDLYLTRPKLGRFDLDHLCAVHRWLFADVYPWAGQLRTVDLTKGDTLFAVARHLETQTSAALAPLGAGHWWQTRGPDQFAARAARLLGDLNALHPFREGNGRTQRAFVQLVANHAGWSFTWADVDPGENLAVSRQAMADPDAFAPLLGRIITPTLTQLTPEHLILHRPRRPDLGLDL